MKSLLLLPLCFAVHLVSINRVNAHGAMINYQTTKTVEIQSRYDTGEPLANAQVSIYTPNNPDTPWQTGFTDETGKFVFTPDTNLTGYWEVKVRQAGHGGLVSIPINAEIQTNHSNTFQDSTSLNYWQRGLMIGSVIWGCIGTALFFTKSPPPTVEASSHSQS